MIPFCSGGRRFLFFTMYQISKKPWSHFTKIDPITWKIFQRIYLVKVPCNTFPTHNIRILFKKKSNNRYVLQRQANLAFIETPTIIPARKWAFRKCHFHCEFILPSLLPLLHFPLPHAAIFISHWFQKCWLNESRLFKNCIDNVNTQTTKNTCSYMATHTSFQLIA